MEYFEKLKEEERTKAEKEKVKMEEKNRIDENLYENIWMNQNKIILIICEILKLKLRKIKEYLKMFINNYK